MATEETLLLLFIRCSGPFSVLWTFLKVVFSSASLTFDFHGTVDFRDKQDTLDGI